MDPNAPKEPLDADAQAEADGGDDEAPHGRGERRWQRRRLFPGGSSPHSSQAILSLPLGGGPPTGGWERRGGVTGSPVSEI